MIIHAPLNFPKGIEYKIFSAHSPKIENKKTEPYEVYQRPENKHSSRKQISYAWKIIVNETGISNFLKSIGIKKLKKTKKVKIKKCDDSEIVSKLQRFLNDFCPSSKFLGYEKDYDKEPNSSFVVLSESNWAAQYDGLRKNGWNDDKILIMPVPESDYWSYWNNCGFLYANEDGSPDMAKSLGNLDFINHLLKNNVIECSKKNIYLRSRRMKGQISDGETAALYPYPSFETEKINENKETIISVIESLEDEKSKDIYKQVIFDQPEKRWKYYVQNCLSNIQYFEYINIKPGDSVINIGIDTGSELPFMCAHIQGKGTIYNLDPLGMDNLSEYVKKTASHYNDILVEKRAFVGGKTSANNDGTETITVDDFVEQNNIEKVDLIKMDIESMEELAVPEMINTIKKFRPQLAISVYHKPDHFWDIPKFLINECEDYKFYFNIYSSTHFEGIFYAIPQNKKD